MQRSDGRGLDEIRPLNFELNVAPHASGSVLVSMGKTRVICAVTIEEVVPRWMKEQGVTGGWLTAEYSMLPYSTQLRKPRDIAKGRIDGRSVEIQRLIGRSLRAVMDLEKLGTRTIWIDCDVLQADGGTRTAAITGASLALAIACRKFVREKKLDAPPMQKLVAAVSAGILDGQAVVDLNYEEDKLVTVDFNLVATEDGEFVEVQASGEEATFAGLQLDEMLALGRKGIGALIGAQRIGESCEAPLRIEAGRDLSSGCTEPRARELRYSGIYLRRHRSGYDPHSGGDSGSRVAFPFFSGVEQRDVW